MERIRALAPQASAGITLNLSDVHAATRPTRRTSPRRPGSIWSRTGCSCPLFRGGYPDGRVRVLPRVSDFDFVRPATWSESALPTDFLGINFYEQHQVVAGGDHMGDGKNDRVRGSRKLVAGPPVTAGGVAIRPQALRNVLNRIHREWTQLPLCGSPRTALALFDYMTPDGQVHDPERIAYFDGYLRAAAEAIADGVPLAGYVAWSLMDNFEWAEGYGWRFGFVYNDFGSQQRTPKDSARWLSEVIRTNLLPDRP